MPKENWTRPITYGDLMLSIPLSDVKGWLSLYRSSIQVNNSGSTNTITLINYTTPIFEIGVIRAYTNGVIKGDPRKITVNMYVEGEQFPKARRLQGADFSSKPQILIPILQQLAPESRILVTADIQDGFAGVVYCKLEGWYY
jgi:hypothetical protein